MKRILFALAAAAVVTAACTKTPDPELSVNPTSLSFESTGGSASFDVSSNVAWTVQTDNQSWYTVSTAAGENDGQVTVTVNPYTEAAARSASLTVTGGGLVVNVAVVQKAPVPPADPAKKEVSVIALGGELSVEIPSGYAFSASSDAEWLTIAAQEDGLVKLAVARNTGSESRSASVKAVLTDGTPLADITVNQSWRNVEPGELLIEEVYFSGSPLEGSDRSYDDQYIRLTNNADHTIYADRVMFVTNFITGTITSAGAYYEYPDVEDGIVVEDMYVIPGSGDEYPLEPGASLILAISAENYQENNPAAFDLSKADFEFYGSDNDYFPDTDNPDVPNLENWFKSSFSYFSLHNRGYESYAIVYAPLSETAESIMGDHHWSGTYYMHFNEWEFTYDIAEEDAWLIPGEWVLDAVNCCTEDSFYRNPWGPAFDAGWTHAGDYDGDPSRFGKSVRRAVDDNGKLVDTNNSTNDFIPNATPTLR